MVARAATTTTMMIGLKKAIRRQEKGRTRNRKRKERRLRLITIF
jgi:hypothetical protein